MKKGILVLVFVYLLTACNGLPNSTAEQSTASDQTAEQSSPPTRHATTQTGNTTAPITTDGPAYYVDQEHCSDVGPGNIETPFCTFEIALSQLQPGSVLTIQPGVYEEQLIINGLVGQPDAPIIVQGQEGVIFDGGCPDFPCGLNEVDWEDDDETGLIAIEDSQHLTVRGLTVQNGIAVGVSIAGGDHITVEQVTVKGTGNAGLLARHTNNLTIINNDIGRAQLGWRDEDDTPQIGAHEALSIVAVSDFEVAYNIVHDTLKEGIDIKENSSRGVVHHNIIERACAVGIYINESKQVQVHNNQVRRSGYYLTSDGRESPCETYPTFGHYFDRYYGTGILLAVGDLGELSQGYLAEIDVYQNVIWDIHGNGIEFWDEWRENGVGTGQMTDNRVFNNTIYRTGLGGIRLQDVENSQIFNNILALNDEDAITGNAIANNTISHNLFHFQHDWQEAFGSDYVIGSPDFENLSEGIFSLQSESVAIDTGLATDLPFAGAAPDIGAYEYGLSQEEIATTPAIPSSERSPSELRLSTVSDWFYMIDVNLETDLVEQIAISDYDMIVLDFVPSEQNNTDYPIAEVIDQLHTADHPKLVLAYIDIGQAEEYRTYWQPDWRIGNPKWIVGDDPDGWEGNFPVAYWYDEWRNIWLDDNGYLQAILNAGFDGVYLDWVEAYSDENVVAFAEQDNVDPREEMIWWITDIAEFTRSQRPDFIVVAQNAAELAENDEYLDVIDAIAQEQVWFDGGADNDPPGDCPLPRTDADIGTEAYRDQLSDACRQQYDDFPDSTLHVSSEEYLQQLTLAYDKGEIIFTVDYALEPEHIAWVYETSRALGFVPFVGNRALDQYVEVFE